MELDAARAVFLRPGEGETIFDRPDRTIRILADSDELALTKEELHDAGADFMLGSLLEELPGVGEPVP